MKTYEVVGDILYGFGATITVEDNILPGTEEFDQAVADELGLTNFGAEEGLSIGSIEEINE